MVLNGGIDMAISPEEFEKTEIEGFSQEQLLTAAVSVLNTLLVKKGVVTVDELQDGIREWKVEKNNSSEEKSIPNSLDEGGYRRVSADFTPEAYDCLSRIAEKLGVGKNESVRRALGLADDVLKRRDEGWKLLYENPSTGERREILEF